METELLQTSAQVAAARATPPSSVAPTPAKPAANVLGAMAPGPQSGAAVELSLTILARRHFPKIITKDELSALSAAAKEFEKEAAVEREHNIVTQGMRLREATAAYSSDPSAQKFERLQRLKVLSAQDHCHVQYAAQVRKRQVFRERIAPLEIAIYGRFASELETEIFALTKARAETYAAFGCAAPSDPLIVALSKTAEVYRLMATHRNAGQGMADSIPELFIALLAEK
jgi:hypothetical protein